MKTTRMSLLAILAVFTLILWGNHDQAFGQANEPGGKFPDFTIRALGETGTVISNPVSTQWRQIAGPECGNLYHCYDWIDSDANDSISVCDTLFLNQLEPSEYCIKAHVRGVTVTDSLDVDAYLLEQFPCPGTPTMTEWGVAVLVFLLLCTAVFIIIRRKRAGVPA